MTFDDRADAGRRLAALLEPLRDRDAVVLGLPRGGVPVAAEVAARLGAPLDVIVVRKLGVPFQPELAMGAIGEGGVRVLNDDVVRIARISDRELAAVERSERAELVRRVQRFRADSPRAELDGRTVIVVDDGIATGATARAACQVARAQGARTVVLAVPVAPPGWVADVGADADECFCLETPAGFSGVGQFYRDFRQISDDEVVSCLRRARTAPAPAPAMVDLTEVAGTAGRRPRDEDVELRAGGRLLSGHLVVPERPRGVVVFAHGSGSSRHSPRNQLVASVLNEAGFATLLFDLLTPEEELDRANVFDISLLAWRLGAATAWVHDQADLRPLPIGYFGASTGAAAALWAASEPGVQVAAIVSRGGRPDLAARRLPQVTAPTLLIVGSDDSVVLDLNRQAQQHLRCEARLAVVPGATHLFEEPGALDTAAALARDWFALHLTRGLVPPSRNGAAARR